MAEDVAFGASPVVTAQDSFSNTVTTDVGSVTLAIDSGPASGILSCSNAGFPTVTAAAGSAAFRGCRITGTAAAGTYTLRATRPGLGQAVSATLLIQAGPADRLAFTTQPGNSTGGTALPVQPRVTVQDPFGNQVTTDTSSVNLAIGTNPGGGLITCAANPVTAIGGVATFAGCAIDRAGTGYTLVATDGALGSATSAAFTVAVGPAARLAFTIQPEGALAGTSFTTQPSVTVQDAGGNPVTASTVPITLAIGTNPSGGALTCTSNPRTAAAGVATFAFCRITAAGVGYTLTARSGTLTAATSNPFDVARAPIARVGTGSTATTARSGSLSPGLPTGLLPNDLVILIVANTRARTSAPPAGWTGVANVATAVGADMSLSVFYRFYQTGIAAPSVAVNTDRGGASARIIAYRNVDTTTPLDVAAATSVSTSAAATFTGPGLTTLTPNALALSIVAQNDSGSAAPALAMISAQGFALEAGFPESPSVGNNGNHHALDLAGKLVATPSTVTFPTFATDRFPRNSVWVGVSIALR